MRVLKLIKTLKMPYLFLQIVVGTLFISGGLPRITWAAELRKIQVVATVGMLSDLVANIGGDDITVKGIMGPGVDPHLYKPNRDDVQILMNADIIFYVGHHLEGRMGDALSRLAKSKRVVPVGERLSESQLLRAGDTGDEVDPHLWMDVGLWSQLIQIVVEELSKVSGESADSFRSRGDLYHQSLMEVDRAIKEAISSIPEKQRVLVTSHDAFRYFGEAYNVEVLGIQGISTESEAGAGDIIRLVNMLVERHVPAIFVESTVAKKNIEALAEGAMAQGHNLKIGGELFADAMGTRGTELGTYRGMMLSNGIKITQALGGDALMLIQLCKTPMCGINL